MSTYTDKLDALADAFERQDHEPSVFEEMAKRWRDQREVEILESLKAPYPPRDRCCVCTEYPWPHGIGVGRCTGAYPVRAVFGAETKE